MFGGSFNPIHNAHLLAAETVRVEKRYDRILFMPTAQNPFKDEQTLNRVSPENRLAMIRLAIDGNPYFEVSDYELTKGGVSYTIDAVMHCYAAMPDSTRPIGVIIGDDIIESFLDWKDAARLLEIANIVVVTRDADEEEIRARLTYAADIVRIPRVELSSSEIRERYANGLSCRYRVPERVDDYIRENALYDA